MLGLTLTRVGIYSLDIYAQNIKGQNPNSKLMPKFPCYKKEI
jgi:hypothetical protein